MSKDYKLNRQEIDPGYADEFYRDSTLRADRENKRNRLRAHAKREKLRKAKERKKYHAYSH